jgi:hypothetical protein
LLPIAEHVLTRPAVGLALALAIALATVVPFTGCAWRKDGAALPSRLSDEEFWRLSTELSESPGIFKHSDNLVSNEPLFPYTIRLLRPRGGVYIGVGPEQNFSYIARLEPEMAFIVDIRQQNRSLHLLYKALFEMSADRADFVSRLLGRPRPGRLDRETSVHDLFNAFAAVAGSSSLYDDTLHLVRERLRTIHGFPLTPYDVEWIEYASKAFFADGPEIHYARSRPDDAPEPSYRALMTATDLGGLSRSYLGSEAKFAFVKDLHAKNLIVPVVGDFGGPTAIKRLGDYVRQRNGVVSAFYSSNVEVYLNRQQAAAFCENLATLPTASHTAFIGSKGQRPLSAKLLACQGPAR